MPAPATRPPPPAGFGRRELNFAESRIDILAAAMELVAEAELSEVPVDEIARLAGVSRMTFFNRFPEKDALWLYFAWIWWFEDTVRQILDPARGFAGIHRIFRRVAEANRRDRRFFQGFAGYITRMEGSRPLLEAMRLRPAEKALLWPDVVRVREIEVVPLPGQLKQLLQEAVEDGEIDPESDVPALMTDLASAMYGEVLMAVVTGARDMWPRYGRQLARIEWYAKR